MSEQTRAFIDPTGRRYMTISFVVSKKLGRTEVAFANKVNKDLTELTNIKFPMMTLASTDTGTYFVVRISKAVNDALFNRCVTRIMYIFKKVYKYQLETSLISLELKL